MVKIRKGDMTAIVPVSVYEKQYKKHGWKSKSDSKTKKQTVEEVEEIETPENVEMYENDIDLSSMNLSELKQYASENGIDISEANTKKEMRAIIEAAINI